MNEGTEERQVAKSSTSKSATPNLGERGHAAPVEHLATALARVAYILCGNSVG